MLMNTQTSIRLERHIDILCIFAIGQESTEANKNVSK